MALLPGCVDPSWCIRTVRSPAIIDHCLFYRYPHSILRERGPPTNVNVNVNVNNVSPCVGAGWDTAVIWRAHLAIPTNCEADHHANPKILLNVLNGED